MKRTSMYIIVAEDDIDDRMLMQDAFSEIGIYHTNMEYVENGDELLDRLKHGKKLPSLIFLDLNMPKMDGRETLKVLKNSERFKHIPVIIFSTSNDHADILSSYQHGGNAYFIKPALYSELVEVLDTIKAHWFHKALLPIGAWSPLVD
ncbi:MAG: response regulator [Cyclobacteriaceae bacterium]|nr:response regulator [Cyclobacteriaceae bacterium]